MRSSYIQNNYDDVFFAIMRAFQPINCVELGVLDGFSSYHIARGLVANGRGILNSYDLFDDYKYKHGDREEVSRLLQGLPVNLHKKDAYAVSDEYPEASVDLLHVDISNNGDTFDKIMEQWDPKLVQGGIILFEGGTQERDEIEWMVKFGFRPIKPAIEQNKIVEAKYIFGTYLKFPGLTMLLKKRS